MKNFNKYKYIVIISWTVVLLWMMLIFYLSAQSADQSNQISKGITEIVVETVERVAPRVEFDMNRFNHITRKNAHFFAYLLLGILVKNALGRSGLVGFKAYAMALGFCVLYAISDEIHQIYVPGRSGEVRDVLIDSTGALAGICLYWIKKLLKKISL